MSERGVASLVLWRKGVVAFGNVLRGRGVVGDIKGLGFLYGEAFFFRSCFQG